MYCPKCGAESKDDATFCWKCGYDLSNTKAPQTKNTLHIKTKSGRKVPSVGIILAIFAGVVIIAIGVLLVSRLINTAPPDVQKTIPDGVEVYSRDGGSTTGKVMIQVVESPAPAPQGLSLVGMVYEISANETLTSPLIVKLPVPASIDPKTAIILHFTSGKWQFQGSLVNGDKLVTLASSLSEFAIFDAKTGTFPVFRSTTPVPLSQCSAQGKTEHWQWRVVGNHNLACVNVDQVRDVGQGLVVNLVLINSLRLPVKINAEFQGGFSWGNYDRAHDPTNTFELMPLGQTDYTSARFDGQAGSVSFSVNNADPDLVYYLVPDLAYLFATGEHIPDDLFTIVADWTVGKANGFGDLMDMSAVAAALKSGNPYFVANAVIRASVSIEGDHFQITPFGEALIEVLGKMGVKITESQLQELMLGQRLFEELLMFYDYVRTIGIPEDVVHIQAQALPQASNPFPASTNGCKTLMQGESFNQGTYSTFEIDPELKPAVPITITMIFTLKETSGGNMLWRYGTGMIASEAEVQNGILIADFRQSTSSTSAMSDLVGSRTLDAPISAGRHEVTLSYNGQTENLYLDGKLVDSASGVRDISNYDGLIWAGRNAYAIEPFYLQGTVQLFQICKQ